MKVCPLYFLFTFFILKLILFNYFQLLRIFQVFLHIESFLPLFGYFLPHGSTTVPNGEYIFGRLPNMFQDSFPDPFKMFQVGKVLFQSFFINLFYLQGFGKTNGKLFE